jgi:2-hydroxy-6-oxonona-2,4-dienedioate hydrolase
VRQIVDGYANLNGRQVYYQVQGEGDPLIMIHAGIADMRMWDEQWEELSQFFKVIRYDRPGFGQSPAVQGAVAHRQDLADLMNHLGITRTHLLGCSMGGELALDFALAFPNRVSALILVSATPSGFEFRGEPPAGLFDMISAMREGDLDRANALQIQISVDGPYRKAAQVDPELRGRFLAMNMAALRNGAAMVAEAAPLEPPAATRLTEVQAPTLVVAGALDHQEILRAASIMEAEIPNAQQIVVQNAGHFLNVEEARAFNRLVLKFLAMPGEFGEPGQ